MKAIALGSHLAVVFSMCVATLLPYEGEARASWTQWSFTSGSGIPNPPYGMSTPTLARQTTGVVPITLAPFFSEWGGGPINGTYALVNNTDSNGDYNLYMYIEDVYNWAYQSQSFSAISTTSPGHIGTSVRTHARHRGHRVGGASC